MYWSWSPSVWTIEGKQLLCKHVVIDIKFQIRYSEISVPVGKQAYCIAMMHTDTCKFPTFALLFQKVNVKDSQSQNSSDKESLHLSPSSASLIELHTEIPLAKQVVIARVNQPDLPCTDSLMNFFTTDRWGLVILISFEVPFTTAIFWICDFCQTFSSTCIWFWGKGFGSKNWLNVGEPTKFVHILIGLKHTS